MSAEEYPITTGVRFLRDNKIEFAPLLYIYEPKGGTAVSARELGVEEHRIIKTLVMETDPRNQFLILMHGDKEVSTKQLARAMGVKSVNPATEQTAQRVTGYQVGGISPFGTRQKIPIYIEASILALPKIIINGGKRGFLVEIEPQQIKRVFAVTEVNAAI
ncbi:MAG: Cys-tRNA(Pro) deacylase [Bacteroidetes bacterium]|nr:Cys-tRNA(Pro) deacylase [Bacteroidota bacterium]